MLSQKARGELAGKSPVQVSSTEDLTSEPEERRVIRYPEIDSVQGSRCRASAALPFPAVRIVQTRTVLAANQESQVRYSDYHVYNLPMAGHRFLC